MRARWRRFAWRRAARSVPLLTSLVAAAHPSAASDCVPRAGLSTCVDVDNLWARPGSTPFLNIGATSTTPPGQVAFGTTATYLSRPLRLEVASPDPDGRDVFVVDNLLDVTFLLALGVAEPLEVTASVPATFYQDGAGYGAVLGTDEALARSVVRDPRFGFALAMLQRERRAGASGFSVFGRFEFAAPFGEETAFAGGDTATAVPAVTADFRWDRLTVAAEAGMRIRGDVPIGEAVWGTQVSNALGVSVELWQPLGLSVGAEGSTLVTIATRPDTEPLLVPAEWLASARMAPVLAGDLSFILAGGGPIPLSESAATAPRFRFVAGVGYAPLSLDTDRDGVLDRDDACPGAVEDRDAFEDGDGCPDPDNDDDAIPDVRDRCRDAAETMDGFQDDDGCPDADDDEDGVPDERDRCRNDAEDRDGFRDEDGCPDPDNDDDGVPDVRDKCKNGPEDKDDFQDDDGCPDPDNDADQIPDASDRCPDLREDKDGFADDDGCPDPDNDRDGVVDARDKCPTEVETLDGTSDDDGCPEPGAKSIAVIDADGRVQVERWARFAAGRSDATAELTRQIAVVAKLVAARDPTVAVLVEAYPDKPGDKSAAAAQLAAARASTVRSILAKHGIPTERITAASGDLHAARPAGAPQLEVSISAREAPPKR